MSRQLILDIAAAENGYTENPSGSNMTKYGAWYGLNGQPWCAIFVSWVYDKAGHPLGSIDTAKGYHYCPSAYNHWRNTGEITTSPTPGDIVLYDWNGDGFCDHTGIFVKWLDGGHTFQAREGNTSGGNNSNGGEVMLRTRLVTSVRAFVSPKVLDAIITQSGEFNNNTYIKIGSTGAMVLTLQKALNAKGANPSLSPDGVFGNETLTALKTFQQKNNLTSDGIAGPETLNALGLTSA